MKKGLDKYCKRIEKNTKKLLFKMFGYKDIVKAIKEEIEISKEIEKFTCKEISIVSFSDIKDSPFLMVNYCKYLTLKSILDTYEDSKRINMFGNDYIVEVEK